MIRHVMYLIGLSIAAVFLKSQLVHVLHFLMYLHAQIANGLKIIFSDDSVGETVQGVLALLLIPIVIGVVCALAHFILKQEHFPHTMTVVWICWAVLLVAVLTAVPKPVPAPAAIALDAHGKPIVQNVQAQGKNQGQAQGQGQGQMQMAQNGSPDSQETR